MTRFWCWLTRKRPRPASTGESDRAHSRALAAKKMAESRWAEVEEVTVSLASLRKRNHFIEGFRKTL